MKKYTIISPFTCFYCIFGEKKYLCPKSWNISDFQMSDDFSESGLCKHHFLVFKNLKKSMELDNYSMYKKWPQKFYFSDFFFWFFDFSIFRFFDFSIFRFFDFRFFDFWNINFLCKNYLSDVEMKNVFF